MKQRLLGFVLSIVLSATFLFSVSPILAADEHCAISANVQGNHVNFTVTQTSGDPFSGWAGGDGSSPFQFGNGTGTNVLFANGVATTSTDYDYQGGTFTASILGPMSCSTQVTIAGPDVPNNPSGGSTSSKGSSVGDARLIGHGYDDCRMFVSATGLKYNSKSNEVSMLLTKDFEDSLPFTVEAKSGDWQIRFDPQMGGEGGVANVWFNPPFELLRGKGSTVSLTVYNRLTGVQCYTSTVHVKS